MTRCNTLNVSSCNSQLNKLKAGIKNGTKVTLNPSSNVTGDSKDENNFSHELLSTHAQISNILILFEMVHQVIQNRQKLNDTVRMIQSGREESFLLLTYLQPYHK